MPVASRAKSAAARAVVVDMDSTPKDESTPSWRRAIAELDAAIAHARAIAARIEAALHRAESDAHPATDETLVARESSPGLPR